MSASDSLDEGDEVTDVTIRELAEGTGPAVPLLRLTLDLGQDLRLRPAERDVEAERVSAGTEDRELAGLLAVLHHDVARHELLRHHGPLPSRFGAVVATEIGPEGDVVVADPRTDEEEGVGPPHAQREDPVPGLVEEAGEEPHRRRGIPGSPSRMDPR